VKRFEFRFQSVAKVRKIEMERQARVLAEAQMKVKEIEAQIEALKQKNQDEVARLQDLAIRGQIPRQMMQLSVMFREQIKRDFKKRLIELREAEAKVREEREKLIEKEKARKVMEKVKERDFENYAEERRRLESKTIDEIACRADVGPRIQSES